VCSWSRNRGRLNLACLEEPLPPEAAVSVLRSSGSRSKIAQYAENPAAQARNVKALSGVDAFRLRVQDFRVVFSETADTITVLDIGPRGGIYDQKRPTCP
jgi:mRNA interferase RelE/StbE